MDGFHDGRDCGESQGGDFGAGSHAHEFNAEDMTPHRAGSADVIRDVAPKIAEGDFADGADGAGGTNGADFRERINAKSEKIDPSILIPSARDHATPYLTAG
jgi:hypothetical protein